MVALVAWPAGDALADPKSDEVERLVKSFVDPDTTIPARQAAVEKLRGHDLKALKKALRGPLRDDIQRRLALILAVSLRVPGLGRQVRNHVMGVDGDVVIDLLLGTREKGSAKWLYGLWRKAAPGSKLFARLTAGLQRTYIGDVSVLKRLLADTQGKDAVRSAQAEVMARAQLRLTPMDDLEASGPKLIATMSAVARGPSAGGQSLMRRVGFASRGYRPVGAGFVVFPGGTLEFRDLPDAMQSGDWTVTAFVRLGTAAGQSFGLGSAGSSGTWRCTAKGKEWVLQSSGGGEHAVPLRVRAWTRVTWDLRDTSHETPGSRLKRLLKLTIGTGVILTHGAQHGRLNRVTFLGGEDGLVVGSLSYRKH